ncbi:hypothetical protein [Modestobacter sp. VKM Ac-2984]|uniref:hypothetical protein n=1 Tax=Modestobacter sp. VKM Ac-2984 TaxID=3004138 RepID=UPI0022AB1418|nr:hypothetical protein [Modestobacter sp. VKM Ac-2984]MCZ2818029.1 hypothetical protein [Modestobacter sp. VKM Ac-2984]
MTLDRDNYVYTARQQGRGAEAELRPGFADAVKKCVDAASDYLWVHGYAGGFVHSPGPGTISMSVPFPLADQAAEALRAAEMDGDLTGLEALTEAVTVPLDEWLQPGERQLRQGVDFTSAPSAFLQFLRARARARGLRLNGRAEPGAVWVHPTMPPEAAELRDRYPDRFGHYPDPALYAQPADDDGGPLRPYVGARSERPSRDATPVVFLQPQSASLSSEQCPCGFPGAETDDNNAGHLQGHMRWSTGVLIPRNLTWYGGHIAVVNATSPVGWRKLAYGCALLPRRENHYDFPSFAVGDGEPAEDNARAYLYRSGRRVVGFVSVFDTAHARWYPRPMETSEGVVQPTDGQLRPTVNVIFTAGIWRRRGVAQELVRAIATDADVAVSEVAWHTPFSDAGRGLATRMAPDGAWLA